jgi:hypothetical protein
MNTAHTLSLHGIDINGMSPEERHRVEEIGLGAWLTSYKPPEAKQTTAQPTGEFSGMRCALGSACMRAENRKGAYVHGQGRYCSNGCRGRAEFLRKREKATFEADNPGMAGIGV